MIIESNNDYFKNWLTVEAGSISYSNYHLCFYESDDFDAYIQDSDILKLEINSKGGGIDKTYDYRIFSDLRRSDIDGFINNNVIISNVTLLKIETFQIAENRLEVNLDYPLDLVDSKWNFENKIFFDIDRMITELDKIIEDFYQRIYKSFHIFYSKKTDFDGQEYPISIEKVQEQKIKINKGGRPTHKINDWAFNEIELNKRGAIEVYLEWLDKLDPSIKENLADPKDSFKKAIAYRRNKRKKGDKKE